MGLYRPHIIGTNHLSYNIDATIRHIESLDTRIDKVMLEMFNPDDKRPELKFDLALVEGRVEIVGIQNNPSVFYGALVRYFRGRGLEPCFAYSTDESNRIDVAVDFNAGDLIEVLMKQGQESAKHINPLILKMVLKELPDPIVIGNIHGEYLHSEIPSSTYVHVEDEENFPSWWEQYVKSYLKEIKKLVEGIR